MARARVKKDMMVTIIAGEDLGHSGKVLEVDKKNGRVLVEGINLCRKAVRRTPDNPQGGIVEQEAPVDISNVMPQEEYNARRTKSSKAQETKQEEGNE